MTLMKEPSSGAFRWGPHRASRPKALKTPVALRFCATGQWSLLADRMIHAYDKDTVKLLWETEIDANPDGIPAVYEVDGREYVAFFAASAQGQAQGPAPTPGSGTDFVFKAAKPGSQGYYVFALPQNKNSIVKID